MFGEWFEDDYVKRRVVTIKSKINVEVNTDQQHLEPLSYLICGNEELANGSSRRSETTARYLPAEVRGIVFTGSTMTTTRVPSR